MKRTRDRVIAGIQGAPAHYKPAIDVLRVHCFTTGTDSAGDVPVTCQIALASGPNFPIVIGTPSRPMPFELPSDLISLTIPFGWTVILIEEFDDGKKS